MGLAHKLLTKRQFDARIKKMVAGRACMADPGSSIENIMPGWLRLVDEALRLAEVLSAGSLKFFRADIISCNYSRGSLNIYVDTGLPEASDRARAIKEKVDQFTYEAMSVCKYCGVGLEKDVGVCTAHANIKSGRFEDDIVYKGGVEQPDIVEPSEVADLAVSLIDSLRESHHKAVGDVVEEYIRFIVRANIGAIPRAAFEANKLELNRKLQSAQDTETREKNPPVEIWKDDPSRPMAKLFDMADLEKVWAASQTSKENKPVHEPFYKALKDGGTHRKFAMVPEYWRAALDDLELEFPNFGAVIESLRKSFALSRMGDGRVSISPKCLNGDPGVGKTLFSQELAKLIDTDMLEVHMEAEQNGSALAGSSTFWSNSKPSKILDVLATGRTISPVVLLDELDKVNVGGNYSPAAGLYGLFETISARRFRDLSFCVAVDASHIIYIATSNSMKSIPVPLLSRMEVFEIEKPTRDQAKGIAVRIYAKLVAVEHYGGAFDDELPDDVAEALADRPPRTIRKMIQSALGAAALDARGTLVVGDLDEMNNVSVGSNYQDCQIGFQRG